MPALFDGIPYLTLEDYRDYQPTVEDLLEIEEFFAEARSIQAQHPGFDEVTVSERPRPNVIPFPRPTRSSTLATALKQLLEVA